MRLSLAIRLGAMLRPQCKHVLFDGNGSCAMGAAAEAYGYGPARAGEGMKAILATFPLQHAMATCPQCGVSDNLFVIIGDHLNDHHDWTRERIASWFQEIEEQAKPQESPALPAALGIEVEHERA